VRYPVDGGRRAGFAAPVQQAGFEVRASGPVPEVAQRLLGRLPDWFGIEQSNREYVAAAARLRTFVAATTAQPSTQIGILLIEQHFPTSAEIHLIAVDPAWHRLGVGRALLAAAEAALRAEGVRMLSVKTLGPSRPDAEYALTRLFYASTGFVPLEEFPHLWPGNPCLLLAKPLPA
jgi:GNAT superfamily N-acetyltransferase